MRASRARRSALPPARLGAKRVPAAAAPDGEHGVGRGRWRRPGRPRHGPSDPWTGVVAAVRIAATGLRRLHVRARARARPGNAPVPRSGYCHAGVGPSGSAAGGPGGGPALTCRASAAPPGAARPEREPGGRGSKMSKANDWTELPIPDFYDPANASRWSYSPDQQKLFEAAVEWRKLHGIRPAQEDDYRIHLLLIDYQKDFCFPEGSLYVGGRSGRGALEDNDRIARFIYRNLRAITHITCTLDTHHPYQIFSPAFWLDENGNPPAPHREVTAEDIKSGRMRPNPALAGWLGPGDYDWLVREVTHYCEQLEASGKYRLYLWPPHCILGSAGHALVGVVHEARMFHSYARLSRADVQVKGTAPLTEYYSVLAPEVLVGHDGRPLAERNVEFVEVLLQSDAVVIAGQAASHC